MRKFYFLCTAMLLMFATSVKADRILFSENYEAGGVPETWTINGGTGSIAGDTEGKYMSFALGQNNGRSAHCLWGESIYDVVKEGLTEYSVTFDFQIQAFGNNQYNGEIAVFSGEKCEKTNGNKGGNWDPYNNVTSNCFFDISQDDANIKVMETKLPGQWFLMGDVEDKVNLTAGTWYTLVLNVNVNTREVTWTLDDLDNTFHKAGSKTMAEDANMYVSGLYLMNARYQSVTNVDNIKVTVPGDFANAPVIALTGLKDSERTYTITFMEGETLHVKGTDGSEKTIGYFDAGEVAGQYVITTTQSGTISAYTTAGSMTSETVTMEVNCEPIVLPSPTYAIISAAEGYEKTYQFTIDNTSVEMQPEIFMDFSFKSDNGTDDFVLTNQNNGAQVTLPSKGTLTVTTKALGYANGSTTIKNDMEFVVKHDIDIQHITADELLAKGFEKMDDLDSNTTSGESNWTARLRLYYDILTGEKDEEGNDLYTRYPVYGYTQATVKLEDGTEVVQTYDYEPIQRYRYLQSKLNEETAHSLFAPMYVWYGTTGVDKSYYEEDGVTPKVDPAGNPGGTTNLQVKLGIGIVFSGQVNDAENYNPNSISYSPILINTTTMGVDGLTDEDIIVVSKITDYGSTAVHPKFPAGTDPATAKAEYKKMHLGGSSSTCKGTETFSLNRVDAALNRVLVLSPSTSGIDEIFNGEQVVISDHNAPVYNLNGVQVNAKNLKSGVYVKQGKKFIVR
ncbi:MAG: hypothetical protein IJ891_11465 [Prevotella sp.]|nr:hypothetical protein [Prevotella sp.]